MNITKLSVIGVTHSRHMTGNFKCTGPGSHMKKTWQLILSLPIKGSVRTVKQQHSIRLSTETMRLLVLCVCLPLMCLAQRPQQCSKDCFSVSACETNITTVIHNNVEMQFKSFPLVSFPTTFDWTNVCGKSYDSFLLICNSFFIVIHQIILYLESCYLTDNLISVCCMLFT